MACVSWNAARDALSCPHVTTVSKGTRVAFVVVAIGAAHRNTRYTKAGGFVCRRCLGRGTGRGFLYGKGGGSCAGSGPGRGPRMVFLYTKGGSCGVHGTIPGQKGGGGSCAGRGFRWSSCGTSCAHLALTILGRFSF